MPAKGTVTVFAALAAMAVSLGGCAFWPTPPGDFNTGEQTEVQYCTGEGARNCAEETRNAIVGSKTDAFHVQLASSYVLLGLGTATGAVIAFDGARGLVKWLALSAAAVLGLDTVVRPSNQRTIYSTAERRITCEIAKYEALEALSGDDPENPPAPLTDLRGIRGNALGNSQRFIEEAAPLVSEQRVVSPQAAELVAAAAADAASNERNVAQLADEIIRLVEERNASLGEATLRIRSGVLDDIAAGLPSGESLLTTQEANVLAQMQRLGVGGGPAQSQAVRQSLGLAPAPDELSPLDQLNALIARYKAVLASPTCSAPAS
jgi:hypothetical protein